MLRMFARGFTEVQICNTSTMKLQMVSDWLNKQKKPTRANQIKAVLQQQNLREDAGENGRFFQQTTI